VDGIDEPIGLDPADVFFGWWVSDGERGALQAAYRIVVSRGATGSSELIWDSKRVPSAEQAFVPYRGPALDSDQVYAWAVQTWSSRGGPGPLSPPARFETGLRPGDWVARWIRRPADPGAEPDQYTLARKEFRLAEVPIARARAYVSADQQYEMYVNGELVGKGQAYSFPDHKYYETLDVTRKLRRGDNAIGILYNWQGPTKGHPAGEPGVIAQVVVHYEDGSKATIVTDGSWRVQRGWWLPGHQRDLEGDLVDYTENLDGVDYPSMWARPGFDDSGWQHAFEVGPAGVSPWTRLVSVRTRVVYKALGPVSLTTLGSGAVVADFGKVYAAIPQVSFAHGARGHLVTLRAGYLLDEGSQVGPGGEPGQVSATRGTQHTDMSYSYLQRGGAEEFRPFDYLGFRYLQVDDPGERLSSAQVGVLARHASMPDVEVAEFSCSEPTIDAIFRLGSHSALYTAQEQFIDTPTREKGPWLWDGFNESQTAMALFGEQNLTRKSLLEFAESQRRFWPNGAVNKIYPTGLGALDINEYTEIYPEWVWRYWLWTGDRSLVDSVFPVLVRLAGYVAASVDASTGLAANLPATNVYYSFPVVTRLNVLAANVFARVADLAEVASAPSLQVSQLRTRQADLLAAIDSRLVRSDGIYVDGLQADGTQTPTASQEANACAVAYGVAPTSRLSDVGAYVASLGLEAPPRTATEVLDTLAASGRHLDLVRLLTDASSDGWARILAAGGTFTWEVWEPSDANGDSMSHGWGSNVAVSIQRHLLGVSPTSAGLSSFEVAPPPEGLSWARGSLPTTRGQVRVSWRRRPRGGTALDLEVPPNSRAQVSLASPAGSSVTEGGRSPDQAPGVSRVSRRGGRLVLEVGAGQYRFAVT
jgi:alpha-L-rhamnosidase